MKLIQISAASYECLQRVAPEGSLVGNILKNSVIIDGSQHAAVQKMFSMVCSEADLKLLRRVATGKCRSALLDIDKAVPFRRPGRPRRARIPNWPPIWVRRTADRNERIPPHAEFGTLKEVRRAHSKPESRLFLIIEHEGNEYIGCLLFNDRTSCSQTYELLTQHIGNSIEQIGSLDVSHLQ